MIKVHLHTTLQRLSSRGMIRRIEISLPPGSSLADLLRTLEITTDPNSLLLVVNGKLVDLSEGLNDRDVVDLIPALSGGK